MYINNKNISIKIHIEYFRCGFVDIVGYPLKKYGCKVLCVNLGLILKVPRIVKMK